MYSLEEIKDFKKKAQELNLVGWQAFCSTPNADLQHICNGVGAEFMPNYLRKATNIISPSFVVSACLHDLQFSLQVGFHIANDNLLHNSNIESRAYYKWYNPLLYGALWRNKKFYTICATVGYVAYLQCGDN